MTINDIIAEGDKVYVLSTKTGTHKGDFLGIPATGNQISVFRYALYRLEDGKIAESWIGEDTASQFQQIGVLPTIAEAIKAYNESQK
jgi:predicted ester cyclase